MGNCNTCNPHYGQFVQPTGYNSQIDDEPSSDYAIYKGTRHYQIPCRVNHVLQDYQKIKFAPGKEQGVQKDDYYFISPYQVYYIGQWKHGKPHGKGEVCFQDGSVLQGWFENGVCNGPENLHVMEDGTHYFGSIRNNMFDGIGKMVSPSGYKIQGQWKDNMPNGVCKETFENGDTYEGTFFNGKKQSNEGVYKWNNHRLYDKYEGGFKDNKINGNGKLHKINGDIITGLFGARTISDCKYHSVASGMQLQGEVKEGQLNGEGNITFKDGRTYEGQFKNGNMHGKGCIIDKSGTRKPGFWFKGKRARDVKNMNDEQIKYVIDVVQNTLKKTKEGNSFKQNVKSDLSKNPLTKQLQPYIIDPSNQSKIQGDKYIIFEFGTDLLLITNKQQQIFKKLPQKHQ